MDRLLREIQVELAPEREPAPALEAPRAEPPPAEPPPVESPPRVSPPAEAPPVETPPVETPPVEAPPVEEPPPSARPAAQLDTLTHLASHLIASMRELLDGYEQVLVPIPSTRAPTRATRAARRPAPTRRSEPDVTVAAGPFPNLDDLREFERAVSRLPGVRDVAVRGYEGADRAIIEVRLEPNRS